MKTKILLSIAMLSMIIISCTEKKMKVITSQKDGKQYSVPMEDDSTLIDDFGNGVYYYDIQSGHHDPGSIHNDFGPALSNFIASHPRLKVSALTPNLGNAEYNNIEGYWIITEPKIPCPCDSVKQSKE